MYATSLLYSIRKMSGICKRKGYNYGQFAINEYLSCVVQQCMRFLQLYKSRFAFYAKKSTLLNGLFFIDPENITICNKT